MMYVAAFPSRAEVDLVFPRNETYAPIALFPILFAFQSPKLVAAMDPDIYVTLYTGTYPNIATIHTSIDGQADGMNLYYNNFSSSDPMYVHLYTTALNARHDPGTLYHLEWNFSGGNCSNNTSSEEFTDDSVQLEDTEFSNTLDFTVQNGAQ
ncbi:hypothetical protein N7495_007812 [Penicillium taxi]|uniref:uncharacterized protein n=1 Tax=Penicillium taxi TaxID=168475 RepID=UPI0025456405|nr:uncharacterized protein N7495_007812 [Penicillium taxi]KAJ5887771.1 hypothetical protein N7495_007812 [Penicillium taxi]